MHALLPMHLGLDHWWQSLLVLLLAFAPFLILVGIVLHVRRTEGYGDDE